MSLPHIDGLFRVCIFPTPLLNQRLSSAEERLHLA